MFSIHETVLAAESAYRREQLLATLPARRQRARRRSLSARIATVVAGRRAPASPAVPRATAAAPAGGSSAQAQALPGACAA